MVLGVMAFAALAFADERDSYGKRDVYHDKERNEKKYGEYWPSSWQRYEDSYGPRTYGASSWEDDWDEAYRGRKEHNKKYGEYGASSWDYDGDSYGKRPKKDHGRKSYREPWPPSWGGDNDGKYGQYGVSSFDEGYGYSKKNPYEKRPQKHDLWWDHPWQNNLWNFHGKKQKPYDYEEAYGDEGYGGYGDEGSYGYSKKNPYGKHQGPYGKKNDLWWDNNWHKNLFGNWHSKQDAYAYPKKQKGYDYDSDEGYETYGVSSWDGDDENRYGGRGDGYDRKRDVEYGASSWGRNNDWNLWNWHNKGNKGAYGGRKDYGGYDNYWDGYGRQQRKYEHGYGY